MKTKELKWIFGWKLIHWSVFSVCIIDVVLNLHTLIRWKWGYYSLELIPPMLVLILLYIINNHLWISRIDRELQELKSSIIGSKEKK